MKVLNLTATGCMGSGLFKALPNSADHQVYGFTRNPDSPAAQKLKESGITLFKGDFGDVDSLDKALSEGFDAIFFTIFPDLAGGDADIDQAKNIIAAAKRNGVKQIIYGSVARTGTQENFDKVYNDLPDTNWIKGYWKKKWILEQLVRDSGVDSWTIVKPPTFIQNVVNPQYVAFMYPELPVSNLYKNTLDPDLKIWWVDGSDVGKYTAEAIKDPARLHQKEITFGTELISSKELVGKLSKASGKDVKLHEWTPEEWEETKNNPFYATGKLLSAMGTDLELGKPEGYNVELTPIDEWLANNKEGTWLA